MAGKDKTAALKRGAAEKTRSSETFRGAKVVGVTTDGIKILKGKGRAPNFTVKEIRAALAEIRAARSKQ